MNSKRSFAHALGVALTLASLGFVGWKISSALQAGGVQWISATGWGVVGAGAIVYAFALIFVAAGWWAIVSAERSDQRISRRSAFRIYAVSQLYKYLPGNVLHFVGRHAQLVRIGVSHSAAGLGSVGEILLLPGAALLVALAAGRSILIQKSDEVSVVAASIGILLAIVLLALVLMRSRLMRLEPIRRLGRTLGSSRFIFAALITLAAYGLFFALSGAVFAILAATIGGVSVADAGILLGIWSGCWALGFLTPGAPGGIGVREALLTAALSAAGYGESAVVIALMMRIVTLAGDAVFALLGLAVGRIAEARQA